LAHFWRQVAELQGFRLPDSVWIRVWDERETGRRRSFVPELVTDNARLQNSCYGSDATRTRTSGMTAESGAATADDERLMLAAMLAVIPSTDHGWFGRSKSAQLTTLSWATCGPNVDWAIAGLFLRSPLLIRIARLAPRQRGFVQRCPSQARP
jgi:hypothetical protein